MKANFHGVEFLGTSPRLKKRKEVKKKKFVFAYLLPRSLKETSHKAISRYSSHVTEDKYTKKCDPQYRGVLYMYDVEPIVKPPLACEQALLFGRAKRAARETGEAAKGPSPVFASPLARPLFTISLK